MPLFLIAETGALFTQKQEKSQVCSIYKDTPETKAVQARKASIGSITKISRCFLCKIFFNLFLTFQENCVY
jgi:hypothetical protein